MNGAIPQAVKELEQKLEDAERRHSAAVDDLEIVRRIFRKELAVNRRLEVALDAYENQLAFLERRLGHAEWAKLVNAYEELNRQALRIMDGGGA